MGLDIITRVTVICDKCGVHDSLATKDNDKDVIGVLQEHLTEGNGWSVSDVTLPMTGQKAPAFCFCPKCQKTEAE